MTASTRVPRGSIFLLLATFWCLWPMPLAAGPKTPRFIVETAAETRTGVLAACENGQATLQGGSAARFLELRQEDRRLPPLLTRDMLVLTTGDRLALDSAAGATLKDNRLLLWPAKSSLPGWNAQGLSVYAPHAAALFWSLPDGIDEPELFFARLERGARKRDVVFLKNGDRLEGTLLALEGKTGCTVLTGAKKIDVPWSKLAGLAWNSERAVRPRTTKPFARVVLEGGTRVSLLDLRFDARARRWSGKTLFGAVLEIPEENLLALDLRQDLALDLADLPAAYEQRPYLGATWPLTLDAAVTGRSLRLGENTYERGIGTHAPCRVTYKLAGKFERFDALVGIDALARRGRARLALQLDGKRIDLNEGKEITHTDAPLTVSQDVRGVRELTLIADLGGFGDVQAHVNWAKARLVKLPSP